MSKGAVRGERMKKSKNKPHVNCLEFSSLFPLGLSFAPSYIRIIGWRLWLTLLWDDFKRWLDYKFCCKRGYHKVCPSSYAVRWNNESMKRVHFLSCRNCSLIFFSTTKDKQLYLRLKKGKRNAWKAVKKMRRKK